MGKPRSGGRSGGRTTVPKSPGGGAGTPQKCALAMGFTVASGLEKSLPHHTMRRAHTRLRCITWRHQRRCPTSELWEAGPGRLGRDRPLRSSRAPPIFRPPLLLRHPRWRCSPPPPEPNARSQSRGQPGSARGAAAAGPPQSSGVVAGGPGGVHLPHVRPARQPDVWREAAERAAQARGPAAHRRLCSARELQVRRIPWAAPPHSREIARDYVSESVCLCALNPF